MAEPWKSLLRNLRSVMKGRRAICVLPCLLSRTQPSPGTTRMGAIQSIPRLRGDGRLPLAVDRHGGNQASYVDGHPWQALF